MPRKAWVYIGIIYVSGLAIAARSTIKADFTDNFQWGALLVLVGLATLAQLAKVEAPDHQLYHTSLVFQFAGVILLQPFYYVLLVAVPHVIEWVQARRADSIHLRNWYLQPFNICVHIISGYVSYIAYTQLHLSLSTFDNAPIDAVTAAVIYVSFNHFLTGLAIAFARGVSLRDSGILEISNLLTDLVMLLIGYSIAAFWEIGFWFIWIAMAPLLLIYRALTIPTLERQAQMDPKTGVWNAAYFSKSLQEELSRAQGLNRPLTVVMADLDLLRNINNTYGHLAGDVVLQGVSRILQEMVAPYDTVARFGGEEFAILMPETTAEQALDRVEAMRMAIAEAEFEVATYEEPLKATMSFGIAAKNGDKQLINELIHCADVAVYQAKENGRNQTYLFNYQRDADLKIPTAVSEIPASVTSQSENGSAIKSKPNSQPAKKLPPQAQEPEAGQETAVRTSRLSPYLGINMYIGAVTLLAVLLGISLPYNWAEMDWLGLAAFSVLVFLVEMLAIEIYVKDTTVSTSAAPYLAGVLLFGPGAAVIIAFIIALVVFFHQRSTVDRLIFNASNHAIGGLICAWFVHLFAPSILGLSPHSQILVSVIAAGIIYLSTTWFVAGAVSLHGNISVVSVWKERFQWLAVYYLALGFVAYAFVFSYAAAGLMGISVILVPLLMLRFSQKQYIAHTEGLVNRLRMTNRELMAQAEEITLLNEELLLTLARSIDLRDPYVMEHSKNVARYAVLTATELGLSPDRIDYIRKAGLLHDIGKLGIPETILFKPAGLNDEEYEIIKEHVNIGADLIYGCHSLRMLIPFVKYHHERYDGRGYPVGLAGKNIPLEARILNLADSVEAMASDRPYKKAMRPQDILNEVKRCAGTQFDPEVVTAFCQVVEKRGYTVIVNSARDVEVRNSFQFVPSSP